MATSLKQVHELILWYVETPPDTRLNHLLSCAPLTDDGERHNRAALRRVYKQLEKIEGARNALLEELASDLWRFDQGQLFTGWPIPGSGEED